MIACPTCTTTETVVVDSRPTSGAFSIRRRRRCGNGHRFSTFEMVAEQTVELRIRARRHDGRIKLEVVE